MLRLSVLGPVEGSGDAGVVTVERKGRELLSLLVLAAPQRFSAERLAEALWREPPPSAVKTLQANISRLRASIASAGGREVLPLAGGTYWLDTSACWCDVGEVARLREDADRARRAGDPRSAAELLRSALRLWRGAPELPDTDVGEAHRRRLDELHGDLTEAHLEAMIHAGDAGRAVPELTALVTAEPLRERWWELLARALYHSGRASEALRALGDARAVLRDEIGVDPGPDLEQLELAILRHDLPPVALGAGTRPSRERDEVRYARCGGVHVAYRTFGDGPDDVLLLNPGLIPIDALHEETPDGHRDRAPVDGPEGGRVRPARRRCLRSRSARR